MSDQAAKLPIHLTRTPYGYTATSPDVDGVSCATPTRDETLAMVPRVFRPWAKGREIEVLDLTGEVG